MFLTRSGEESTLLHTSRLFSSHNCTNPPFLVYPLVHFVLTLSLTYPALLNVSPLSLSCLLLTLFIAHIVSFSFEILFSQPFVFALPLSFSIPGTVLSSHTFIPTFPAPPTFPIPLSHILHHFGIPRLSLVSSFHTSHFS